MRWPWQKREQRSYTDSITSAFVAAAEGVDSAPLAVAALETAAGLYARSLAAAEVDAPEPFKRALTPSLLAQVGRDLIRGGESFHLIQVIRGNLKLLPQSSVTTLGDDADPMGWTYLTSEYGPSSSKQRTVRASQMLHVKYAVDRFRPWQGIPPWIWARDTSAAAAGIESILSREAQAPHGSILGLPASPQVDEAGTVTPLDLLRADLGKARGKTLLMESPSQWQGNQPGTAKGGAADITEFGLKRELLDKLRTATARDILVASGVPLGLVTSEGDGTRARESFRQFMASSLQPVAKIIAEELSQKFEVDISFSFENLHAADVAGRARAFKQLIEGGLSPEVAGKNAGISV